MKLYLREAVGAWHKEGKLRVGKRNDQTDVLGSLLVLFS